MRIVLYVGLHQTDGDKFFDLIQWNRRNFSRSGVHIPPQNAYLTTISHLVNECTNTTFDPDARRCFLDAISDVEVEESETLILCHDNFFCVPKRVFHRSQIYGSAEKKLQTIRKLFAKDDFEIFLSLKNPATFLPGLLSSTPINTLSELLQGLDPLQINWFDFTRRLSNAVPDVPITIWCDEDSPLVWADAVRKMAGVSSTHKLKGALVRLKQVMSPEGLTRLRPYLKSHPELTHKQQQKAVLAFLDKYTLEDNLYEEIDVPGWDQNTVLSLTKKYENAVAEMTKLPNVRVLYPFESPFAGTLAAYCGRLATTIKAGITK